MRHNHRINLLPPDTIAAYHRARRNAVLSRIVLGIGMLALIEAVFAASTWLYLRELTVAEEARYAVVSKSEELRRASELEDQLDGFAKELVVLRDLKVTQYDPSFLVREISNQLPQGAVLRQFQLVFEDSTSTRGARGSAAARARAAAMANGAPQITLAGGAETRRDVLDFEGRLKTLEFVQEVESPIENIIHPEDVSFTFDLTLIPAAQAGRVKIEASENAAALEEDEDEEETDE
jgi:Tfp pilus assembly protein PilN